MPGVERRRFEVVDAQDLDVDAFAFRPDEELLEDLAHVVVNDLAPLSAEKVHRQLQA